MTCDTSVFNSSTSGAVASTRTSVVVPATDNATLRFRFWPHLASAIFLYLVGCEARFRYAHRVATCRELAEAR